MSYEKDIPTKVVCPCGEGFIVKESESNDFGQIKEFSPYIDCPNCKNNYSIVSEYFCPKPKHDFTIYYIVNNKTKEKTKINI